MSGLAASIFIVHKDANVVIYYLSSSLTSSALMADSHRTVL